MTATRMNKRGDDSVAVLADLLSERRKKPSRAEAIDARIRALFEERWCVVFTDMCGFSSRARDRGIIDTLAVIDEMEQLTRPVIDRNAGFVVKRIADSLLLLFRDLNAGVRACVEMRTALTKHNARVRGARRIELGFGVGFGDILKLGDEDVYGFEVNLAAKLGEDVATAGEILLSRAAADAMALRSFRCDPVRGAKVAGQTYYRLASSRARPPR